MQLQSASLHNLDPGPAVYEKLLLQRTTETPLTWRCRKTFDTHLTQKILQAQMINNQLTGSNHVGAIKCPFEEKKVFAEDANFQQSIVIRSSGAQPEHLRAA